MKLCGSGATERGPGCYLVQGGCAWVVVRVRSFFFFNDAATTEIYTLSLHDALPIYGVELLDHVVGELPLGGLIGEAEDGDDRSEEHTSELQSLAYLVCRLLLEKKKVSFIVIATTSNKNIGILSDTCYAFPGHILARL